MIFSWEFSKLLESIIFLNIFICVEKLNFIKNYMETRRETSRGGRSSPHFVLRNRTLIILDIKGALRTKNLSKHFWNEIKTVSIEIFSAKIKRPYFLPSVFVYLLCVYRGIPSSAVLLSFLVCWKNLDQFLLRQSAVNHPTMTLKIWKCLI